MAAIHFDDLQWEHGYNRIAAYGQSKLANLLFAYELDHRLERASKEGVADPNNIFALYIPASIMAVSLAL